MYSDKKPDNFLSGRLKKAKENLNEAKEIISDQINATPMLDIRYTSSGTFGGLGLFLIILFVVGASVLQFSEDLSADAAVLFFLVVMFGILFLILWGNEHSGQKIEELVKNGRLATATIIKRREVEDSDDRSLSYHYICTFDAYQENTGITEIKASLPEKDKDIYEEGDTLTVLYSPKKPTVCTENPTDKQKQVLFNKSKAKIALWIAFICLALTVWGIHTLFLEGLNINDTLAQPVEKLRLQVLLMVMSFGLLIYAIYLFLRPSR